MNGLFAGGLWTRRRSGQLRQNFASGLPSLCYRPTLLRSMVSAIMLFGIREAGCTSISHPIPLRSYI
jgi:hypothetical protein